MPDPSIACTALYPSVFLFQRQVHQWSCVSPDALCTVLVPWLMARLGRRAASLVPSVGAWIPPLLLCS